MNWISEIAEYANGLWAQFGTSCPAMVASAVASDYFRKMSIEERKELANMLDAELLKAVFENHPQYQ